MTAQRNKIWTPTYFPRFPGAYNSPLFRGWYRLTTPQDTTNNPGFRIQEIQRRARMLSNIVLAEMFLLLGVLIFALLNHQSSVAYSQSAFLGMFCLALWQNRQGHRLNAALLVVIISELSIIFTLALEVLLYGNSALGFWGVYYLLIPEIIAILLLPILSIFVLSLINCLFLVYMVFNLANYFHLGILVASSIFVGSMGIFLVVACITLLWRQSVAFMFAHTDSIEIVAALEHAMAEQEHIAAQQKQKLDQSIHQLMQTHLRIANGEYDVRVPIGEGDILWPIAGSLNTLLARIQRLGRSARKLEKTEQEAARLAEALRSLRTGGVPVPLRRSGTAIDLILIELSTTVEIETEPPS